MSIYNSVASTSSLMKVNCVNPASPTITSFAVAIPIIGDVSLKVDPSGKFAVMWNQYGRYCFLRVNVSSLPFIACQTTTNYSLTTPSDMVFSPDGSKLIL